MDVFYLLKRGLAKMDPRNVTVVEYDKGRRPLDEHPVGLRYRALLGDGFDWRTEGFEAWLRKYTEAGKSPLTGE